MANVFNPSFFWSLELVEMLPLTLWKCYLALIYSLGKEYVIDTVFQAWSELKWISVRMGQDTLSNKMAVGECWRAPNLRRKQQTEQKLVNPTCFPLSIVLQHKQNNTTPRVGDMTFWNVTSQVGSYSCGKQLWK